MAFLSNIFKKINCSTCNFDRATATTATKSFFELPEKEKQKIIESTARQANDDQKQLMERYQKEYGQIKI